MSYRFQAKGKEKHMDGILYGIGTGPGDPELLTLKAVRKIRDCSVIAVPVSDREYASEEGLPDEETQKKYCRKCVAYQIAEKEIPEMEKKEKIYLPMPMVKEKEVLERAHERSAILVEEQLKKGRDVAFLTLGDPSVYSTYLYVRKKIEARGFQTVIIPGVPSFCAAAARLGTGLSENVEELHILPASYQIEEGLSLQGTKVLMKAGKKMPLVKESIRKSGGRAMMVTNCGMPGEKVYQGVEEMPDDAGYYSLVIVKEEI